MTKNMEYIRNVVTMIVEMTYNEELPSLEQIYDEAEKTRANFAYRFPITDKEFEQLKKALAENILHTIGDAVSLKGKDSAHRPWYSLQENDGFYWNRYRQYLLRAKLWGTEIVDRLHKTTNDVMGDLGNPQDHMRPFQRRGLLLGDVQSGKTATYTAICNKASDAGYRVIIVLAGMMENLRVQTQERLDAEFAGIESKYTLDRKANHTIQNRSVGVGKIPPFNQDKRIACFTSVATDFNKATLRALGLSLRNLNGTALFVVKKNKSVLNNLYQWLMDNNADYANGLIDLPLLLIDDEADNASVNTNSEEKDPTAINAAIRNILNCFRQASYIGITATPFANIFINPEDENDEASRDLFPKDFLTVLPTPDLYIGADKIFGNGDTDDWGNDVQHKRSIGQYNSAIIPIKNEEQEFFFAFKHKKEIADSLYILPGSLKKAIRYFVLATAISNIRKDETSHRSMLVNVSRFTIVQNKTAELIEEFLRGIISDLENYSKLDIVKAMKVKNIVALKSVWDEYNMFHLSGIQWDKFLKSYLLRAAKRIEVRAVNQEHGASSLNYYDYKGVGFRVIAVGGNSLSRGLTLEGLCVSYFYRNTMMYDTLLQMGRWFGYRPNYDDLFKIWIAEDAIEWYGYITDAVNELKDELRRMALQHQTPKDFGLKVRQAPGTLLITARNKMRTATSVSRPITVSGRMLETPRLRGDKDSIESNENLCRTFIKNISRDATITYGFDSYTNAHIWRKVPKSYIIDLVRNYITHPWNLNFQPAALAQYIEEDDEALDFWDVAIPEGKEVIDEAPIKLDAVSYGLTIHPERRPLIWDNSNKNMLKVYGRHIRIGSGGCTKIGLPEASILDLRKKYGSSKDSTFLMVKRHPLALIHILKNVNAENRQDNDPDIVFALGLGFPYDGKERTANYMVNINELRNWVDIVDEDDSDDDD